MKHPLLTDEEKKKKYLVAFSGGPDSVYLLFRLACFYKEELPRHVALVYINYHDSPYVKEEERIVFYYQRKYRLTLFKKDVTFWKYRRINFEEWARNYRYYYFSKLIQKERYDALLTGHQLTDHVETYLLQQKRNNLPLFYGLRRINTLKGMTVLRPLLDISKRRILEILQNRHFPYYDDITNTNLEKQRNHVRSELKEESLLPLAKVIHKKNQELHKLYDFFSRHPYGMPFSLYDTLNEEEKKRYCFFLLDQLSIAQGREGLGKNLFSFLNKHGNQSLPLFKNYVLYRFQDTFFTSLDLNSLSYSYTYEKPGVYHTKYFDVDLRDLSKFNFHSFPVTIRNFKENDRMDTDFPIQEVSLFLSKQSVPSYMKHLYPVFLIQGKIKEVPFPQDIKRKKTPIRLKFIYGIR